jgi:hypothetical protein
MVVETKTDGRDLDEVRAKIDAVASELKKLRALPMPGPDVEERVRACVAGLGKPKISGLGNNEKLRVIWPGAGWISSGPREDFAEVLPMMALLFPSEMTSALLRQIASSDAMPIADRDARMAVLEQEIESLEYVEEALITAAIADGEDVQRSPNASPQAVLGVRIAEATSSRAA